jgi:hypothetical protein
MTGKIVVHDTSDKPSPQEMRDVFSGRVWNAMEGKLDSMIEEQRGICESAQSMEQLAKAQGSLATLKRVKQLPGILARELR